MNILIVEDDKFIRLGLRRIIERDCKGFNVVGECINGVEATKFKDISKVDIIITDIKMPLMNGIEVIKYFKENNFQGKMLVLSGFDEYGFVREAMTSGAVDYLLKPIEKEQLIEVLDKIKNTVTKEREAKSKIRNTIIESKAIIDENIIREILESGIYEGKCDAFKEEKMCTLVCYSFRVKDLERENTYLYRYFNNYKKEYKQELLIGRYDNELLLVYNKELIENIEVELNRLKCLERRILWKTTEIDSLENIKDKYEELSEYIYEEYYEVMTYRKDIKFNNNPRILLELESNVNRLITDIEVGDIEKFTYSFNKIIRYLADNNVHPKVVNELFKGILDQAVLKIEDFKGSLETINKENKVDIKDYIIGMRRFREGSQYINNVFISVLKDINSKREGRSTKVIELAKDFIKENYKTNITLVDVANQVYLNPNYFSELFKKNTGKNFVEYLVEVRVSKARQLLKVPGIKIYEVANQVGYKEHVSFNRAFKRVVGMSPKEYIELVK